MTWTPSVVTERRVGCKIRFRDTAGGLEWGKGGEEVKKRHVPSWTVVILMMSLIVIFSQK